MSEIAWSRHPDDWGLQEHQVDIWRIHLDLSIDPGKPHESVISAEETQRAARFHFPRDRNRFILAHRAMREILAQYLNCCPGQLDFSTNGHGKPSLSDGNLQFNLSHSGTCALLAVSPLHKVGIDVEQIRTDVEIEVLARRFFSQLEHSELMAIPREQRVAAFYRYWTLKEAYIKAQGLGLSLPLDSFDLSLTSKKSGVLKATRPDPHKATRWTLLSLEVDPEYAGAVAVENKNPEFRHWDWNSLAAE